MYQDENNWANANDEGMDFGEDTRQSKAKRKNKGFGKKPLLIAIVAAVVVLAVIVVSVVLSAPMTLVGRGFANSFNAMEKNSVVAFTSKVVKGGSLEAVLDMGELLELPVDGKMSLKLYSDSDKGAAITADVKIAGDEIIDVGAYFNKENIAVASDVLFGSDAYGISLTDVADRFNHSVFGMNGEYSLGIELSDMGSWAEDAEQMAKDGQAVSKALTKHMLKSLKENTDISKKNDSLSLNGEKVKVAAVKIKADGDALVAVITDLVDYLQEDEQLEEFLRTYAEYYADLMVQSGMVSGNYENPEDVIDEFYAMVENTDVDVLAEELEDTDLDFALTFYIKKSGKELIGVQFEGEVDGDKVKVSAIAGPSWKNLEEIAIRVEDGYNDIRITYTVDTNDKKEYSAKLKVRESGENVMTGKVEWDKKDGDFAAELSNQWGDVIGAEGYLEVDSKSAAFALDSVYENSDVVPVGLSLNLLTSDKMPDMPDYTELLDMSAGEIEALVYDLQEVLSELTMMFYSYMY